MFQKKRRVSCETVKVVSMRGKVTILYDQGFLWVGGYQQGLRQDSQGGQREGEHLGHCQGYMYEGQSGETTRVTNVRGGVEFPREVISEGGREMTHHPENVGE